MKNNTITKEKLIKIIEKMRMYWSKTKALRYSTNESDGIEFQIIYNMAIDDILHKINDKFSDKE